MATNVPHLIEAIVEAIDSDERWELVRISPRLVKAIPRALELVMPSIGEAGLTAGKRWLTLDFCAPNRHGKLGIYWQANPECDREARNSVLAALLKSEANTGFFYEPSNDAWRAGRTPAFAGGSVSESWWPEGGAPELAAARRDVLQHLDMWAARVPAFVAAIRSGTATHIPQGTRDEVNSAVGEDWSSDEVSAAIEVYFDMLARQLGGEVFVKAERMRTLASRTRGRSVKSAEFKCQNISAVLLDAGLPRLSGYAPATNYQGKLADAVAAYLADAPEVAAQIRSALNQVPPAPPVPAALSDIVEPPPAPSKGNLRTSGLKRIAGICRGLQDDHNRRLGDAGEQFVVELERAELIRRGRTDLADQVRWVAKADGDGFGYDVRSYAEDGAVRYIEVKTTNGPKDSPFYLTPNELAASHDLAAEFRLYRLFSFSTSPRLFVLAGDLNQQLTLEATEFRARVGAPAPAVPEPNTDLALS